MTISSTSYSPATYTGAGTGPYQFDFECLEGSVFVLIDDEVSPIGFSITLNGDGPIFQGGQVTFDSAVPGSSVITIGRATPQDQQVDYQIRTRFPAQTHEFALDKLTLMVQEGLEGGGSGPTPGAFLPLAGGTMNDDAAIGFGTAPTNGAARLLMASILGVPAMVMQPLSAAPDMGFVFQIDDSATKTLAADVDGVWAITGRPDFEALPDNALATKADVQTGGGQFLPLAGGTMNDDVTVTWGTAGAGGGIGEQTFAAVLGAPGFFWRPEAASQDIGYVFQIDSGLTTYLAGGIDGTWAIEGRPAFAGLPDTAIAIKADVETRISRSGDTWDAGVTQVFPKGPSAPNSSDAEMAFINFFGINALRIQAATAETSLGIGYLLLTDQQNIASPFLVGSKTDGFRIRNQLFADPDDIVTVQYVTDNALADAPIDGSEYVRKDGFWVLNTGGSGGEANTTSNQGAGVGLALPKAGADLPFKTIVQGTNITITEQADTITIAASGTVGVAWGSITGTLSNQTDLQAALDGKMSLTGGTWAADVTQLFTRPAALPSFSGGSLRFTDFLGLPGWLWGPQDIGGTEQVGYLWDTGIGVGPALGGNPTDGFEIRSQVLSSSESIITRGLGDGRYAPLSHTHPISQIIGLQAELDSLQTQINGKAPSSAVNTATWGQINGTLANQSDLEFALDAKPAKGANETITGIWTFSAGFSASVGVVLSGGALCGGSRLQGVGNPIAGTDAATRQWVEANFVAL